MSQDSWNITFTIDHYEIKIMRNTLVQNRTNFLGKLLTFVYCYFLDEAIMSLKVNHPWQLTTGELEAGCVHLKSDGETGRTTHACHKYKPCTGTVHPSGWVIPQNINTTDSQKSTGLDLSTDAMWLSHATETLLINDRGLWSIPVSNMIRWFNFHRSHIIDLKLVMSKFNDMCMCVKTHPSTRK